MPYLEPMISYDAFDGGGWGVVLCGYMNDGLMLEPFHGRMVAPEQSSWPRIVCDISILVLNMIISDITNMKGI